MFEPAISYNCSILDYQKKECEVRLYGWNLLKGVFRCDEDGVIQPRKSARFENDDWCPFIDGFAEEEIREGMVLVHDLDEINARKERSLSSSFSRTRSKVYELARGQHWDWFITFTFSPDHVDRYDFSVVSSVMSRWLSNIRKRCPDMRYIVVPEQHKDGAWHFHGIFADITELGFAIFPSVVDGVYNVHMFRYGYTTATRVEDEFAVSNYICKYITKDLCKSTFNRKRYWASRNLSGAEKTDLAVRFRGRESDLLDRLVVALGDDLKYINITESPMGDCVYLQVKGSGAEVLERLAVLGDFLVSVEGMY